MYTFLVHSKILTGWGSGFKVSNTSSMFGFYLTKNRPTNLNPTYEALCTELDQFYFVTVLMSLNLKGKFDTIL